MMIKKGETITVNFTIYPDELSYYHQDMSYSYDPGDFELFIGSNSRDTRKADFQ